MSHPDEGTIHAWLDGALAAYEATELEAHVAGCGECQAAVAEARGLIAASSRILGALDNVPANVVPKTEHVSPLLERLRAAPVKTAASKPVKRWPLQVWAVAATVVMVAGVGIVVQNSQRVADTTQVAARTVSAPNAVVAESTTPAFVDAPRARAAGTAASKPAAGSSGHRIASAPAASVAREADALVDAVAKQSRANALAGASAAPSVLNEPVPSKVVSQVAGGAGAASGIAKDAAGPASALARQLSEKAKESGDAKRSEGFATAIAQAPAEKKALGELRAADKTQDALEASGRPAMKSVAPAPASSASPAASCARITLGNWRSTSQSVAHGATDVTARPGPAVNAAATVTLGYADGPRTEIGAWLVQPDTARLTVRDARDETILRLLVSRTAGTGIAVLTSAKDNATATATARVVPDGCVVQKPE